MHPRKRRAVATQSARFAARGPDQGAVANRLPARKSDLMLLWVDREDTLPEQHRDLTLLPKGCGPDEEALERLRTREIILGERGALVDRKSTRLNSSH